MPKTNGISPKLIADALVSVVAFAIAVGLLKLDPIAAAALAKTIGTVAAFWAPPGAVRPTDVGPPSDELLEQRVTPDDRSA